MDSNESKALLELVQSVSKIGDLLEIAIKDWRRSMANMSKDIDELPTIVRMDLDKLGRAIESMVQIVVTTDSRRTLERMHRILSKARHDLWMSKQASPDPETESAYAVRRMIDYIRDSVRAELNLEPEALEQQDRGGGGGGGERKAELDDTGVRFVLQGKTVAKIPAAEVWAGVKKVWWVVLIPGGAALVRLWDFIAVSMHR